MLCVWAFRLNELHILQTFRDEFLRKISGHKQDEASNLENYTGLTYLPHGAESFLSS